MVMLIQFSACINIFQIPYYERTWLALGIRILFLITEATRTNDLVMTLSFDKLINLTSYTVPCHCVCIN